ncbi:MAG: SRPBCC domain-containing protein [Nevskiales bacterium]|nr:SRPBCC domain-containing protein [Nevskiales bacterium]
MAFIIDRTLEIDAPAAIVWEVISDLPRYREWNPFCLECSSTLRPGDPIDMKVQLLARPQRQREWMLECDEGTGFAYRMKPVPAGALSSRRSHAIEAIGPGRARYHSHFELKGWLMPLVRGLLGRKLEAGFGNMSAAVKQRAELLWSQRQTHAAA